MVPAHLAALVFGSALTIMNFHADVNMLEVQIRIVEMVTGKRRASLFVPDCILARARIRNDGVLQSFVQEKWNEEPTPLEVEMYLYQENLDQFVVAEEYRKMNASADTPGKEP